jgi:hypothetical protein
MSGNAVPIPFLMGVLAQESGLEHFQVPNTLSRDNFVTIGLDRNNSANPAVITSRGFGVGQYTLFHHPPTPAEVATFIVDPVQNVSQAASELLDKFQNYVSGASPATQADDRINEHGSGPLRSCVYPQGDQRYHNDCANCLRNAGLTNIVATVTPFYSGSSQTYERTQYHVGSYTNVPIRGNIPCDWPYAVRRYNGSGANSYDYQAEVLQHML